MFEYITPTSPLLKSVQDLGDHCRNTVGFLPREAFFDYAKQNGILALTQNGTLLGYVMFRFGRNDIIVVQLCVAPEYRKMGIAKQIIQKLSGDYFHSNISGITLNCRRDYHLESVWQGLGFCPVNEKLGRATNRKTRLTTWFLKNPQSVNLFNLVPDSAEDKFIVFLDTNIAIEMAKHSAGEQYPLLADYIPLFAKYFIPGDVMYELNKYENEAQRKHNLDYSREHFQVVYENTLNNLSEIEKELLSWRPVTSPNSTRDLKHIAAAIAYAANIYITDDSEWLRDSFKHKVFDEYSLQIMNASQFVLFLAEQNNFSSFLPYRLAGLSIRHQRVTANELSSIVTDLHEFSKQKKAQYNQAISNFIAYPDTFTVMGVFSQKENHYLALYVYEKKGTELNIPELCIRDRELPPNLAMTLVKNLVFRFLDIAMTKSCDSITIVGSPSGEKYADSILTCDYTYVDGQFKRYLDKSVRTRDEVFDKYVHNPSLKSTFSINTLFTLEKKYWPLIILDSGIPCYIVPIQADYAQDLFDENLANENLSLFENKYRLPALSPENVYFKSARNSIPTGPAHILWYVSNGRQFGTSSIRAVSMLNGVEIGPAKTVYRKYQRLGVLTWEQLKAIAHGDIACYNFCYTQLFKHPISLEQVRASDGTLSHATFQSRQQISINTFITLFKQGME